MVVDLLLREFLVQSARTFARLQIDLPIAHPFTDRHAKAFLRTIQDLMRQVGFECFLEDVLALPVPKPIFGGYRAHKVYEVDIQERSPHFK